ncbi:MAG: hypothetical protein J7K30_10365 [Deltaproteobacteria bacterium]|nr:hypothetical protein [Deltaproteobacteria bacterium]
MKHFKLLCLLTLFMAVVSVAFAAKLDRAIWWELESVRMDYGPDVSMADMLSSMERPKTLTLRQGKFPLSGHDKGVFGDLFPVDNASIWIRNPDGEVSKSDIFRKNGAVVLDLPHDLNPGNLTGRYLVGIHLDAGVMDFDSDGTDERVHLYSNYLVRHYKQDGAEGKKQDRFFMDRDKMALEIGPIISKRILKNAGCPVSSAMKRGEKGVGYVRTGGFQMPLKEHKMKVIYKGRPLADAEVAILSKSGWKKTVMTNSEGVLSIILPKTRPPSSVSDMTATMRSNGKKQGDSSTMGKMMGKGMNKSHHKGEDKVGHAGQGMSENAKHRMAEKSDRVSYESVFRMEDKLLYMVVHKDASTGEYHCATLPMSLRTMNMGGSYQSEWRSKAKGFGFWGIMGASLGIVGVTGNIYRKKKRNRDTIFKSKKS